MVPVRPGSMNKTPTSVVLLRGGLRSLRHNLYNAAQGLELLTIGANTGCDADLESAESLDAVLAVVLGV